MAFVANNWWHVDSEGRKIGWLWPEDFVAILESYYGVDKSVSWVLAFAQGFGYSRAQVDRWAKGTAPIPKNVAMTVSLLGTMKTRGIPLTLVQAEWLPDVEGANAKLGTGYKPFSKVKGGENSKYLQAIHKVSNNEPDEELTEDASEEE
jgi:hypothetical protein